MNNKTVEYGLLNYKTDVRDYTIVSAAGNTDNYEIHDIPKVKNQAKVSSCVAHALSTILEFFNQQETGKYRQLSTDFIYGMQGIEFGRLGKGMVLRDACKLVKKYGDALYDTIPTNTEMPVCAENLSKMLTDALYTEAKICKIQSYALCKTENDIKYALTKYGPVVVGIRWYDHYTIKDGVITFDQTSPYGNHALVVYGFNETGWLIQNSWGALWGNHGRFVLPYSCEIREAWSFVDAENEDVHKPKRNKWLDVVYTIINMVVNLFRCKN